MWVTQPKIRVFDFFLELHIINIKYIVMKKNKSKIDIEEVRKNSKWLKLFENVPSEPLNIVMLEPYVFDTIFFYS